MESLNDPLRKHSHAPGLDGQVGLEDPVQALGLGSHLQDHLVDLQNRGWVLSLARRATAEPGTSVMTVPKSEAENRKRKMQNTCVKAERPP